MDVIKAASVNWNDKLRSLDLADVAVVLVHGYLATIPWLYWAPSTPVWRELRRSGCAVTVAGLPATGKIEARARRLGATIRKLRRSRVICLAHSMGGLDARYCAWRYDTKERIETIITLNTPHFGTPLADWAGRGPDILTRLLRSFDEGGLRQLTPEAMSRFNEQVTDRETITYRSIGSTRRPERLSPVLKPYGEWLQAHAGDNDGLVPVTSTRRYDQPLHVEADHLEIIGHRYDSVKAVRGDQHLNLMRTVLADALTSGG